MNLIARKVTVPVKGIGEPSEQDDFVLIGQALAYGSNELLEVGGFHAC